MSTRHLMLPVVALGVLAMAVSGCGGDDDSAGTSTTKRPAVEETTAEETPTSAGDAAGGAGVPSECTELLEAFEGTQEALSSDGDVANSTEQFQVVADAIERARENAPEEIAADLEIMSTNYQKLAASAAEVDWDGIAKGDPAASAAAGKIMQGFASEDLAGASQRVSTWLGEHCVPSS